MSNTTKHIKVNFNEDIFNMFFAVGKMLDDNKEAFNQATDKVIEFYLELYAKDNSVELYDVLEEMSCHEDFRTEGVKVLAIIANIPARLKK